jgi:hypothetical protein
MEIVLFLESENGEWGENIDSIIKDFKWTSPFVPLIGDRLNINLENYELRIDIKQENISGIVTEREFSPSENILLLTLAIEEASAKEISQELNRQTKPLEDEIRAKLAKRHKS